MRKEASTTDRGDDEESLYPSRLAYQHILEVEDVINAANGWTSWTASKAWFRKVSWRHHPGASHTRWGSVMGRGVGMME
jgi:hypothetical protein